MQWSGLTNTKENYSGFNVLNIIMEIVQYVGLVFSLTCTYGVGFVYISYLDNRFTYFHII